MATALLTVLLMGVVQQMQEDGLATVLSKVNSSGSPTVVCDEQDSGHGTVPVVAIPTGVPHVSYMTVQVFSAVVPLHVLVVHTFYALCDQLR